jgi:hypothetical protein
MMYLPVSGKYLALVDDDDYKYLREFEWFRSGCGRHSYPYTSVRIGTLHYTILLHRLVMGCRWGDGKIVDHRNHNVLDAQKSNLRFCKHGQNISNQMHKRGNKSSRFHGVYFHSHKRLWAAQLRHNNKQFNLGYFRDELAAAKRYDEAARAIHGEFASLNFT